jgi:small subunit ribosomal protein S6e
MGAHIPMDTLGDNFKGYIVKITGGNDREGFPMR